ncbi:MAG: helix-turn-helix transcriptional regulator [Clostridia bacterium]|nr:helix-turn-helix transcriptional regulator [Clostridia bacterium]
MKNTCRCALRDYMTKRLAKTRKEAGLTQAKFSEQLMMDTRSYAALEHGKSLCCTLTFIIYMARCCKDTDGLIRDLRQILQDAQDNEMTAS